MGVVAAGGVPTWVDAEARGGGRPEVANGAAGRGGPASGGKRVLAAKGQVPPLWPGAGAGGAVGAARSGARGAPARMRSRGVASRAPGVAGACGAVAAGVPGSVKLRAAPGWLGGTCTGGGEAVGRVKPPGGTGPAGAGGDASGGPS
jgi:hypothetical protein